MPGAESNHRHEDFQSTALPLSYPGTGDGVCIVGWRPSMAFAKGSVQRLLFIFLVQCRSRGWGLRCRIRGVSMSSSIANPTAPRRMPFSHFAKINVRTALCEQKGRYFGVWYRRRRSDSSFKHLIHGMRSRFRCSSNSMMAKGVHPASVVSTGSALKAAATPASKRAGLFWASGPRSRVI